MYRIAICDDCRQDQEKLRRMIHQTLRDKPVCPYQIVVMESGEKLLSLVMDARGGDEKHRRRLRLVQRRHAEQLQRRGQRPGDFLAEH